MAKVLLVTISSIFYCFNIHWSDKLRSARHELTLQLRDFSTMKDNLSQSLSSSPCSASLLAFFARACASRAFLRREQHHNSCHHSPQDLYCPSSTQRLRGSSLPRLCCPIHFYVVAITRSTRSRGEGMCCPFSLSSTCNNLWAQNFSRIIIKIHSPKLHLCEYFMK